MVRYWSCGVSYRTMLGRYRFLIPQGIADIICLGVNARSLPAGLHTHLVLATQSRDDFISFATCGDSLGN
jgi:hypothetical protein